MYQRSHVPSERAIVKPYRFLKIPIDLDIGPLIRELAAIDLPWAPSLWKWHRGTDFCVLRGGPAGARPGDRLVSGVDLDAPITARLPAHRQLLDHAFPAPARVAWIGRSPPGATIRLHVDNTSHWDEHHRVHIPLVTSPHARLCVEGRFLHMPAGSCWLFNNSRPHGALNDGPARLHLILDLPPTPGVLGLLARGREHEGTHDPAALARLATDPLAGLGPAELADAQLMHRYRHQ